MAERPEVPPIRFTAFLPFVTVALIAVLGFWPTSFPLDPTQDVPCGSVLGSRDGDGLDGLSSEAWTVVDDDLQAGAEDPVGIAEQDAATAQAAARCSDARAGRAAWMLLVGVTGISLYLPTRARNG